MRDIGLLKGDSIIVRNTKCIFVGLIKDKTLVYNLKDRFKSYSKELQDLYIDVDIEEINHIPISIDFFKEKFLVEDTVNLIFQFNKIIHFKEIDLPFWFEFCSICNKFFCKNEYGYNFEISTESEVLRIFNSFKIKLK